LKIGFIYRKKYISLGYEVSRLGSAAVLGVRPAMAEE